MLDRAHLVQGDSGGAADRPAGLDREPRHGQSRGPALPLHDRPHGRGQRRHVRRVVPVHVGDAEAAAEIQVRRLDAELVRHPDQQARRAVRGHLEAGRVEDLRADVRVHADQVQRAVAEHPAYRLERVPGRQRETELLVLVRGRDELVGVRLHADGRPDQHRLPHAALLRQPRQPGDLHERVQHHPADAGVQRPLQLGDRLVVAVQGDPVRRYAGAQRRGELAAGAHVQAEALLCHPAQHRGGAERLRRVVHVGVAERGGEVPAPAAQVRLVQHVRRSAVLGRQVAQVDTAEHQRAAVASGRGDRPDRRRQPARVVRRRERPRQRLADVGVQRPSLVRPHQRDPVRSSTVDCLGRRGYMRSGAETPSSASPLARTIRVASQSASRACVSGVAGSSPIGSTRHAS